MSCQFCRLLLIVVVAVVAVAVLLLSAVVSAAIAFCYFYFRVVEDGFLAAAKGAEIPSKQFVGGHILRPLYCC